MQRDLVERARQGDHDAFAELAGAAISQLTPVAWLILRDPEQAQDAVQNALVRVWRDLPTLRDPDRFDAWARRLVVRSCIDEARRLRRHRFDVRIDAIAPPTVADGSAAIVDRDQLERAFRRLDPDQRAVLVLHYYVGMSVPQVAETLGVPLGTAQSRLARALATMRSTLGGQFDAESEPFRRGGIA